MVERQEQGTEIGFQLATVCGGFEQNIFLILALNRNPVCNQRQNLAHFVLTLCLTDQQVVPAHQLIRDGIQRISQRFQQAGRHFNGVALVTIDGGAVLCVPASDKE